MENDKKPSLNLSEPNRRRRFRSTPEEPRTPELKSPKIEAWTTASLDARLEIRPELTRITAKDYIDFVETLLEDALWRLEYRLVFGPFGKLPKNVFAKLADRQEEELTGYGFLTDERNLGTVGKGFHDILKNYAIIAPQKRRLLAKREYRKVRVPTPEDQAMLRRLDTCERENGENKRVPKDLGNRKHSAKSDLKNGDEDQPASKIYSGELTKFAFEEKSKLTGRQHGLDEELRTEPTTDEGLTIPMQKLTSPVDPVNKKETNKQREKRLKIEEEVRLCQTRKDKMSDLLIEAGYRPVPGDNPFIELEKSQYPGPTQYYTDMQAFLENILCLIIATCPQVPDYEDIGGLSFENIAKASRTLRLADQFLYILSFSQTKEQVCYFTAIPEPLSRLILLYLIDVRPFTSFFATSKNHLQTHWSQGYLFPARNGGPWSVERMDRILRRETKARLRVGLGINDFRAVYHNLKDEIGQGWLKDESIQYAEGEEDVIVWSKEQWENIYFTATDTVQNVPKPKVIEASTRVVLR